MLIDEAFNGKGLDEVMYCFQPNAGGQQLHDDIFEELYESSENEGAQSAEAEDEIITPSQVDDNQSENDRESQLEYHDNPIEEDAEDVDADVVIDDVKYYDDYVDLDDSTIPSQAPEVQEAIQITDESNGDIEVIEVGKTDLLDPMIQNGIEQNSPPAPDSVCYCDRCLFSKEEDGDTANETNRPRRNPSSEWMANQDTQSDDAHESYDAEQNVDESASPAENAGFDLIELTDDDDAAAGAGQADSSVTATLTGDGDGEIDLGEGDQNNVEAIEQGSPANPSNEIDWRDFTEENEDGSKDALSSSGKRPRPDGADGEELLSEGQNGKLTLSFNRDYMNIAN